MASIRAQIVTAIIGGLPGFKSRKSPQTPYEDVERSRRTTRLMTIPQWPGTSSIPAAVPNVDATWHVGTTIRDDVRLLYFHGGAYCAGSSLTHRHFTSILAKRTGIPVLSVDYRLAPEHPFPAAFDDAVAAYRWIKNVGPKGEGKARKIIIAGDSAGGGLTIATAIWLRDQKELIDGALMPLSPWMDLTCSSNASERIGHLDVMLSRDHAVNMAGFYGGNHDLRDPRISPKYGRFAGLPPMYVTVGGRELILDEAMDAIHQARAEGVHVTVDRNEEMFHVWPLFFHVMPEAKASVDKMINWLIRQAD